MGVCDWGFGIGGSKVRVFLIRVRVTLRVTDWGFVIGGLGLGVPRLGFFN